MGMNKMACDTCGVMSNNSPCTVCRELDGLPDLFGNPPSKEPPCLNQLNLNLDRVMTEEE